MAKKSAAKAVLNDVDFDDIFTSITQPITTITELDRSVVSWSPGYDECLGGGVVSGSMVNLIGDAKLGKCELSTNLVTTYDGKEISIGDIVKGKLELVIPSWNGLSFQAKKIIGWHDNGIRKCIRIITKTGRTIEVTENHPLLTTRGWNKAENLKIYDFIAVPKKLQLFGKSNVTYDEVSFIAYMTADGNTDSMKWYKTDHRLINDFASVCQNLDFTLKKSEAPKRHECDYSIISRGNAQKLCQKFSIYATNSKNKYISDEIMSAPKEIVARFLQVLISSDGSFYTQSNGTRCIEYGTSSEKLAKQVFSLLIRFGIVSKIQNRNTSCNGKKFKSWRIFIFAEEHINIFLGEIGWMRDIPEQKSNGKSRSFLDMVPIDIAKTLYNELKGKHIQDKFYSRFGRLQLQNLRRTLTSKRGEKGVMRQTFLSLKSSDPLIEEVLNSPILWDQIVSIEQIGKQQTFGIEVEDLHNYVSNNIISHNTSSFLTLMRNLQKPENGGRYWGIEEARERDVKPGRPVVYVNVEGRITRRDIYSVPGMDYDPSKFGIITSTDKVTLFAQQYFEKIQQIIDTIPGCVILIDSIGMFCTRQLGSNTDGEQIRDPAPLLTSQFMKKILQQLMPKDITLLAVLHKAANTGGGPMERKHITTGGSKAKYSNLSSIEMLWGEPSPLDEGASVADGKIMHIKCVNSELGPENTKADSYLLFNHGLWNSYEMLLLATSEANNGFYGVTKSGGGYYTISLPELQLDSYMETVAVSEQPDKLKVNEQDGTIKIQKMKNIARWIDKNPIIYQAIYNKYKAMNWPQTKIYEKN